MYLSLLFSFFYIFLYIFCIFVYFVLYFSINSDNNFALFFLSEGYVQPEVAENLSAVKLIAINPNELDEEDAIPTTPMLNGGRDGGVDSAGGTDDAVGDEKVPTGLVDKVCICPCSCFFQTVYTYDISDERRKKAFHYFLVLEYLKI